MKNTPQEQTLEDTRFQNRHRRKHTELRRKKSGLLEMRMYFDEVDKEELKKVAAMMGYENPTNEDLSGVLSHVLNRYRKTKRLRYRTAKEQYLVKIHRVVRYQRTKLKLRHSEIVQFFKEYYDVPQLLGRNDKRDWDTALTQLLFSKARVQEIIKASRAEEEIEFELE